MNWNLGFSAKYELCRVDPVTWRDVEQMLFTEGSVERSTGSLMESASLTMTERPGSGEVWLRVYLEAKQGNDSARVPLFTGLTSVPERSLDGTRETYSVNCYSVLKPADDILCDHGWYAPSGVNGAKMASDLLSVIAPVEYDEGSPALQQYIIAEDGETCLSMAQKIIAAIGWRIRITGDGTIHIVPEAAEISATFDALENDSLELSVTDTRDWFSCPNRFIAVLDDSYAMATDEDPASVLSYQARGRWVDMMETDCDLNAGETLAEYAGRRLREEQSPGRIVSYSRRFRPGVVPSDLVRIHYPAQDIDGIFEVQSQSIEFGYGCRTTEKGAETV